MTDIKKIEIDPNMQYILAGDISGSMSEQDPKCGGNTRYNYMLEKFESFIREAEDFDPDGPTVMLFSDSVKIYRNTTIEKVKNELRMVHPSGYTMTDLCIQDAFRLHLEEKSALAREGKTHPGTVLFVFTDGAPTNREAVKRNIINITRQIEKHDEFNIGFLTVGTISPELKAWLTDLDENLKGAKYDIVNVSEIESVSFLKAVDKAINE